MSALLRELALVALALALCAAAVGGLGDRGVLVPPPETVVEEFVGEIALERWEPARRHLVEAAARRMEPDSLRAFLTALEQRAGRVEDVRGTPSFATAAAAQAVAEITTVSGARYRLRLPLEWEHGLWKISRLDVGG